MNTRDIREQAAIRLTFSSSSRAVESGESYKEALAAYEALQRFPPLPRPKDLRQKIRQL